MWQPSEQAPQARLRRRAAAPAGDGGLQRAAAQAGDEWLQRAATRTPRAKGAPRPFRCPRWQDLRRHSLDAARLSYWAAVRFAAFAAQHLVRLHPRPHDGPERPVRRQAVGGTEGEALIYGGLARWAVDVLRRQDQPRDRAIRALVLGPLHVRVLDRHPVKARAELNADHILSWIGAEEIDHRGAQVVFTLDIELCPDQGLEGRVIREHAELGDVVAVVHRALAIVGLIPSPAD